MQNDNAEISPKVVSDINHNLGISQNTKQVKYKKQNKTKQKTYTLVHYFKTKDKKKNLEEQLEGKTHFTYGEPKVRFSSDFSSEIIQARKVEQNVY